MPEFELVYSDMLDTENKLEIHCSQTALMAYVAAYSWRICFIDEKGMSCGSDSDGQWYETQAACEAAGRVFYLMEEKDA